MRVFAGIPVPEPARSALAGLIEELRAHSWPVRWVRPDGLHLTLKFFGSIRSEMISPVINSLTSASAGIGPLPLHCTSLGSFPAGVRARVVWIGLEAPGTLELLQNAVERACESLGFPIEGRPYHPHITLGRVTGHERLPSNLFTEPADPYDISFLAEDIVLFQSRPGREGSIYTPLHTIPLSPCAAV
jgi:2'-5' RNA ligase